MRHLSRIASEIGAEKLPGFMAMMCADLTLVTEILEVLGIPRDEMTAWRPRSRKLWPSTRMRYVGPLYAKLERPVPEHVEHFLAEPGKVVLVAPTSGSASLAERQGNGDPHFTEAGWRWRDDGRRAAVAIIDFVGAQGASPLTISVDVGPFVCRTAHRPSPVVW